MLRRAAWRAAVKKDLLEAVTVVEETNRIRGLEHVIKHVGKSGTTLEIMQEVIENARRVNDEKCPYIVWALPQDHESQSTNPIGAAKPTNPGHPNVAAVQTESQQERTEIPSNA